MVRVCFVRVVDFSNAVRRNRLPDSGGTVSCLRQPTVVDFSKVLGKNRLPASGGTVTGLRWYGLLLNDFLPSIFGKVLNENEYRIEIACLVSCSTNHSVILFLSMPYLSSSYQFLQIFRP